MILSFSLTRWNDAALGERISGKTVHARANW